MNHRAQTISGELREHGFLPAAEQLATIPGRYDQHEASQERAVIHLHYIGPESHWWIAELWENREEPGTWEAYGYVAICPGDAPKWSHISLTELERASLAIQNSRVATSAPRHDLTDMNAYIERDLTWTPRPAYQCVPGVTLPGDAPDPERIDADPASQQDRRR